MVVRGNWFRDGRLLAASLGNDDNQLLLSSQVAAQQQRQSYPMHILTRPVWQRHPRYMLSVFLIIIATICFLSSYQISQPLLLPTFASTTQNNDLSACLERAEGIYGRVVQARQGLIRKFGPTPSEVAMCVRLTYHAGNPDLLRRPGSLLTRNHGPRIPHVSSPAGFC